MDSGKIVRALKSEIESDIIEAIYNIDESHANNIEIIEQLRRFISHSSPDIREISVMRLSCRLGDQSIKNHLKENMLKESDDLAFSACVRGLVCLSQRSQSQREDLLSFLNTIDIALMKEDRVKVLHQAMIDIRKYT